MSIVKFEPNVSIIIILDEFKELLPILKYNYENIDYPQDKLEWIIIDDSVESSINDIPLEENVIYIHMDNKKEYIDKIEFGKNNKTLVNLNPDNKDEDENKDLNNFHIKCDILPNGFKRDYGVGLASNEYILHMDVDCLYHRKNLRRKLKMLSSKRLECIYCDSMLCYKDKLYKTENELRCFEGTLLHTIDFWKKGGFKWSDMEKEGDFFHYNKGNDRKQDNYYDTIKLIHKGNITDYRLKDIKLENLEIDVPDFLNNIDVVDNKLKYLLRKIFKEDIRILGLNSELIKLFDGNIRNVEIEKKVKEKKLIQDLGDEEYNILFFNYKNPIWEIFSKKNFDCVIMETNKNIDAMRDILLKNDFLIINNIFIKKSFLIN